LNSRKQDFVVGSKITKLILLQSKPKHASNDNLCVKNSEAT
jgi:hypothetical protein